MRIIALRTDTAEEERPGVLRTALEESGIWRMRQSLSLCASREIIELAVAASDALVAVQDVLISNLDANSDPYLRARADLWVVNAELREAMRKDLGVSGPPDPELGRYRYPR